MSDDWLDEVELPRDTVDICIKPALVREYERVCEQLRQVERSEVRAGRSLAPKPTPGGFEELDARKTELEEAMRAATKQFEATAIDRDEYRDLVAKHPPRTAMDKQIGYDVEAFTEALITRCLITPAVDVDRWRKLRGRLNAGQVNKIQRLVHSLNSDEIDLPF